MRPPKATRFKPGGVDEIDNIDCDRCGSLATRSYEGSGNEWLQLCESCYDDLGSWLGGGR